MENADLKQFVLREIQPVFRASSSPKLSEAQVENAVNLFFELLEHRVGDPNLDGIGIQILLCLSVRCRDRQHAKIADRFEPFAKFVLRLAFPAHYAQLTAKHRHRFTLAEVLKALGMADESELKDLSCHPWQDFPPSELKGKPDFKEQVGWTYRFRNTEDHLAPELSGVQESIVFQSVCVCLIWLTAKNRPEIESALIRSKFSAYLQQVRDCFAEKLPRFIDLATEVRSPKDYRILDPLAPLSPTASSSEQLNASKLTAINRVTTIEAEPGAGKTTTLQFVAWQNANGLLTGETNFSQIPVFLELKLLSHRDQTIEKAVHQALQPAIAKPEHIPWDTLLLLVDGMNEVAVQRQAQFKAEIRDLVSRFSSLRLIISGRPNSFRGEFDASIVVLKGLTDEQLANLFQRILGDEDKARALLASVLQSPFLASWSRTPLHAALIVAMAKGDGIAGLVSHSATVRRCVRKYLDREANQASAAVIRTDWEGKELILAYLAFETKRLNQGAFSRTRARSILLAAKAKAGAASLDISRFLEEVRDNHLIRYTDEATMEFAHELYHDYFAATELEAREQSKAGLGVEFASAHFSDVSWSECIRLFAGFSECSRILIERGAERNPLLAWQLLRDANDTLPDLAERVSDEAYCALSAELNSAAEATMAGACMIVLADLGRADLLEQAITELQEALEPTGQLEPTDDQIAAAQEKLNQVTLTLGYSLLLLVEGGLNEQRAGQEGRLSQAARSAIRGLERIKAARQLCLMLSAYTGSAFIESSVLPGAVLDALINMGVDEILNRESESMNQTMTAWLKRACEAGFSKAWPAYGRVLRLARDTDHHNPGIEFDGDATLKWLRKAHDAGDSRGTLELALLLIEVPELAAEVGEGELVLRQLAATDIEACCELGKRLLSGNGIPRSEAEGIERLLSAATAGRQEAVYILQAWGMRLVMLHSLKLPAWAEPYRAQLKALLPANVMDLL